MTALCLDEGRDLKSNPLRIGDVVMLKSGGPAMTVTDFEAAGDLDLWPLCIWHSSDGKVHTRTFKAATLTVLRRLTAREAPERAYIRSVLGAPSPLDA